MDWDASDDEDCGPRIPCSPVKPLNPPSIFPSWKGTWTRWCEDDPNEEITLAAADTHKGPIFYPRGKNTDFGDREAWYDREHGRILCLGAGLHDKSKFGDRTLGMPAPENALFVSIRGKAKKIIPPSTWLYADMHPKKNTKSGPSHMNKLYKPPDSQSFASPAAQPHKTDPPSGSDSRRAINEAPRTTTELLLSSVLPKDTGSITPIPASPLTRSHPFNRPTPTPLSRFPVIDFSLPHWITPRSPSPYPSRFRSPTPPASYDSMSYAPTSPMHRSLAGTGTGAGPVAPDSFALAIPDSNSFASVELLSTSGNVPGSSEVGRESKSSSDASGKTASVVNNAEHDRRSVPRSLESIHSGLNNAECDHRSVHHSPEGGHSPLTSGIAITVDLPASVASPDHDPALAAMRASLYEVDLPMGMGTDAVAETSDKTSGIETFHKRNSYSPESTPSALVANGTADTAAMSDLPADISSLKLAFGSVVSSNGQDSILSDTIATSTSSVTQNRETASGPQSMLSGPALLVASGTADYGTFTELDARCAAHGGDGIHFFGSPNMDSVPELCLLQNEELRRRKDGRLGPHSNSLWPQRTNRLAYHLMCIPKRPESLVGSEATDYAVLWYNCGESDWLACIENPALGSLNPPLLLRLKAVFSCVQKDLAPIRDEFAAEGKLASWTFPSFLMEKIDANIKRLEQLSLPYHHAINTFGEATECLLELVGYLTHHFVVKAAFRGKRPFKKQSQPLNVLGAFTDDDKEIEWMTRLSIPCYFIRKYDELRWHTRLRIGRIVELKRVKDMLVLDDWPASIARETFAHTTAQSLLNSLQPVGPLVVTERKRKARDASRADQLPSKAGGKRRKTKPSVPVVHASPMEEVSALIGTWQQALDKSKSRRRAVANPPPSLYAFPPVHLFYRSKSRFRYVMNYLRGRAFLHGSLIDGPSRLPFLRTDQWRHGLLGDGPHPSYDGSSVFDLQRLPEGTISSLRPCIQTSFSKSLYCGVPWRDDLTVQWKDRSVNLQLVSADKNLVAEILWEINEIGFRLDAIAVHLAEMGIDHRTAQEGRLSALRQCLLAVSPSEDLRPTLTSDALEYWQPGLWSKRKSGFQRFLSLLCQWHDVPKALYVDVYSESICESDLSRIERVAFEFFCDVFFRHFNRDPLLPTYLTVLDHLPNLSQ